MQDFGLDPTAAEDFSGLPPPSTLAAAATTPALGAPPPPPPQQQSHPRPRPSKMRPPPQQQQQQRREPASIYDIPEDEDAPTQRPLGSRPRQQQQQQQQQGARRRNAREYFSGLSDDSSAWWYLSAAGFDDMSDALQRRWCHVGALVVGGAGVSALAKCDRCRKKGYDCIVYKKSLRIAMGGKAPKGCAACMPNNRECGAVLRDDDDDDDDEGCARCDEKDARIAELEREVAELKWRLQNE